MERKLKSTEFERLTGDGNSISFTNELGQQIAYLDHYDYSTDAAVTVFNPTKNSERRYDKRPVKNALGILDRHLEALGYSRADAEKDERWA